MVFVYAAGLWVGSGGSMALRAVAFHSTIRLSTIDQQLMDYDLLAFDGPVATQCPSCGATFVAFFVNNEGTSVSRPLLELQEKLLGDCNRGMHALFSVQTFAQKTL
jgi:hypothetical protein